MAFNDENTLCEYGEIQSMDQLLPCKRWPRICTLGKLWTPEENDPSIGQAPIHKYTNTKKLHSPKQSKQCVYQIGYLQDHLIRFGTRYHYRMIVVAETQPIVSYHRRRVVQILFTPLHCDLLINCEYPNLNNLILHYPFNSIFLT